MDVQVAPRETDLALWANILGLWLGHMVAIFFWVWRNLYTDFSHVWINLISQKCVWVFILCALDNICIFSSSNAEWRWVGKLSVCIWFESLGRLKIMNNFTCFIHLLASCKVPVHLPMYLLNNLLLLFNLFVSSGQETLPDD